MNALQDVLPENPWSPWYQVRRYRDFFMSLGLISFGQLYPKIPPEQQDLKGKTAIVTGANSGIGLQLAYGMALQNASVYLACRNESKAKEALKLIKKKYPSADVHFLQLDTSSLDSVRLFAKKWKDQNLPQIDIVFHNAGIVCAEAGTFTPDGQEAIYTTNFLSSFLLTHLLEPHLSPTARILFTSSSSAHFGAFFSDFEVTTTPFNSEVGFHYGAVKVLGQIITQDNEYQRYANSKLMQNVFANLLQRYFDQQSARNGNNEQRRLAFAVSPGLTRTEVFSKIQKPKSVFHDPMLVFLDIVNGLGTDVAQGAATAVYLASSMDERVLKANAGGMWEYMGHRVTHSDAYGKELLERFWTRWQNDAHVEWT